MSYSVNEALKEHELWSNKQTNIAGKFTKFPVKNLLKNVHVKDKWQLVFISGDTSQYNDFCNNRPFIGRLSDNLGANPLHYAALSGNPKAVEWVLTKNPKLYSVKDNQQLDVFAYALASKNDAVFKALYSHTPEKFNALHNGSKNTFVKNYITRLKQNNFFNDNQKNNPPPKQNNKEEQFKFDEKFRGALHGAAYEGNLQMLMRAYQENPNQLNINDQHNQSVFDYARAGKNPNRIVAILKALQSKAVVVTMLKSIQENGGRNIKTICGKANREQIKELLVKLKEKIRDGESKLNQTQQIKAIIELGSIAQPKQSKSCFFKPVKTGLMNDLNRFAKSFKEDQTELSKEQILTMSIIMSDYSKTNTNPNTHKLDESVMTAIESFMHTHKINITLPTKSASFEDHIVAYAKIYDTYNKTMGNKTDKDFESSYKQRAKFICEHFKGRECQTSSEYASKGKLTESGIKKYYNELAVSARKAKNEKPQCPNVYKSITNSMLK